MKSCPCGKLGRLSPMSRKELVLKWKPQHNRPILDQEKPSQQLESGRRRRCWLPTLQPSIISLITRDCFCFLDSSKVPTGLRWGRNHKRTWANKTPQGWNVWNAIIVESELTLCDVMLASRLFARHIFPFRTWDSVYGGLGDEYLNLLLRQWSRRSLIVYSTASGRIPFDALV